jgi:SOS response associated peptidase (SRAP)
MVPAVWHKYTDRRSLVTPAARRRRGAQALVEEVEAEVAPLRELRLYLMCDRYVRRSDRQRIAEHFHVQGPSVPDFGQSYNVAPQTSHPVIRLNRDTGEREIVLMRWGLIPFWMLLAKSAGAPDVSESQTL